MVRPVHATGLLRDILRHFSSDAHNLAENFNVNAAHFNVNVRHQFESSTFSYGHKKHTLFGRLYKEY